MIKPMRPCDLFPMIGQDEYEALKLDIQEHGQREPILLVDGEIVDGRNRLRACNELGIDPIYRQLTAAEAGDVFALVMSLNFHRRHLKPHEKGAALAAYMERVGAKKQRGKRTDKAKGGTSATLAEVADKLGVPEATARFQLKAAEDYQAAAPEQQARVDAGEITPKQARKATEAAAAPADETRQPARVDPWQELIGKADKFRNWLRDFLANNPTLRSRVQAEIRALIKLTEKNHD